MEIMIAALGCFTASCELIAGDECTSPESADKVRFVSYRNIILHTCEVSCYLQPAANVLQLTGNKQYTQNRRTGNIQKKRSGINRYKCDYTEKKMTLAQ